MNTSKLQNSYFAYPYYSKSLPGEHVVDRELSERALAKPAILGALDFLRGRACASHIWRRSPERKGLAFEHARRL